MKRVDSLSRKSPELFKRLTETDSDKNNRILAPSRWCASSYADGAILSEKRCTNMHIRNKKGEMYLYAIIICVSLLVLFYPLFEYIGLKTEIDQSVDILEERLRQYATVLAVIKFDEIKGGDYFVDIDNNYLIDKQNEVLTGAGFFKEGQVWKNNRDVIIDDIAFEYKSEESIQITMYSTISVPYKILGVKIKDMTFRRRITVSAEKTP